MPKDPDNPYGIKFRGRERGLPFIRPYRNIGELNPVERQKLARHPFEVALAIVNRYAKEGPAAIKAVPGEVDRLKWVGLYPQRQGGDAFMMRIKVPGGVLTAPQAREIGIAADAFGAGPDDSPVFGNRIADITTRQSIQLHWIRMADVPRIWERFWDVGLTTVMACGDCARNVCCCPVSGVDADEVVYALPVAREISAFFTANREYANLPRKFKIAVTGCVDDCARVEIDDIGLWPARADDGTVGFNVLAGGGLSDGERMASDIDVFVRPDQAVELTRAIAQVFGELGNREHRGLSRMRYLVQEMGPEGFRAAVAERAAFELAPAGEELTRRHRGDHVGVHPQKQPGLVYVGCTVPVGRLHGVDLIDAARLAETYGDGTVRLSTDQSFVLSGIPEARVDDLLAEPLLSTYSPFPGPFTRGMVACTGTEFCRFAVVETKARAARWARTLDQRLAGVLDGTDREDGDGGTGGSDRSRSDRSRSHRSDRGVIRIHLSGCSAGCAQPQIADVGLRGDIAHVDGHIEEALDIGFGGSLGPDAGFLRWVSGRVPADKVADALVRVVARYVTERRPDEQFVTWCRRVPLDQLRATVEDRAFLEDLDEEVDDGAVGDPASAGASASEGHAAATKRATAKGATGKPTTKRAAAKPASPGRATTGRGSKGRSTTDRAGTGRGGGTR